MKMQGNSSSETQSHAYSEAMNNQPSRFTLAVTAVHSRCSTLSATSICLD